MKFIRFCRVCHLYPPFTTCYQYTVHGMCCTFIVQIVWLLHGANRYWAPWKWAMFTSSFWNGQCIKVAFTSTQIVEIILFDQIPFKKIVIFQSHVLEKPLEANIWRQNYFLVGLIWVERHNLICWFFSKIFFIGWNRVSGLIIRYSRRILSHLTMYSWQSVHLGENITLKKKQLLSNNVQAIYKIWCTLRDYLRDIETIIPFCIYILLRARQNCSAHTS